MFGNIMSGLFRNTKCMFFMLYDSKIRSNIFYYENAIEWVKIYIRTILRDHDKRT